MTVEKFIGDAVMAVFGLPQIHGNDATEREVGKVAQVLKKVHFMCEPRRNEQPEEVKTWEEALTTHREHLGAELADCLAYIFKLANYTGVDLQEAYLRKMRKNVDRTWKYETEHD